MKIKAERELEGGVETEIGRGWSIEWGEDLRGQNNWKKEEEQSYRDGGDGDKERGEGRGMERAAERDGEG